MRASARGHGLRAQAAVLSAPEVPHLNAYLADRCIALACGHAHPEQKDRKVFEVLEEERELLMPYRGAFDGFHATSASVSKTCLVHFDANKYSVSSKAVGRPVDVHAYADRIVIKQDGIAVGEHQRRFAEGQVAYDPWHYVPVLARNRNVGGRLDRTGHHFRLAKWPANADRNDRMLTIFRRTDGCRVRTSRPTGFVS